VTTSQTIKVCHLAPADVWGGAEAQLLVLLSVLSKVPDLEVSAVLLNEDRLAHELARMGINTLVIPEASHSFVSLSRRLIRHFAHHPVDVLHTHKWKDNALGAVATAAGSVGRLVRTVHGFVEPLGGLKALKMNAHYALDNVVNRWAVDRILTSGKYSLADSFPQNFRADNYKSRENIFVVKFIAADNLGMGVAMAALHYCQYAPLTPWNGFATLAQTFNSFDPADKRRNAILIGPQRDVLTGALVTVRVSNACPAYTPANALVFTDSIGNIRSATEGEGPRIYKWPADPAHVAQNSGNDFAWFRLGEIYLIKAEAQHVLGQDAPALTVLNTLRARTDPVAPPLAAVSDSVILRERLFELFGEVKRRQDLVRFGKFTNRTDAPSGLVGGKAASADYYVLMPIPQSQISANPMLLQNPGY